MRQFENDNGFKRIAYRFYNRKLKNKQKRKTKGKKGKRGKKENEREKWKR